MARYLPAFGAVGLTWGRVCGRVAAMAASSWARPRLAWSRASSRIDKGTPGVGGEGEGVREGEGEGW